MEILFVVDSVDDIDKKIAMFEPLGADIKFFVDSKCVAKLVQNKKVLNSIVAMYSKNVNITIDKYLKSSEYTPTDTILYYASADLTPALVEEIRENLQLKPNTIYVKKKFGWWDKIKLWFYHKFIKLLFGMNDEYASVKLQYFNEFTMGVLAQTSFKNHIFGIPNSVSIELKDEQKTSFYNTTIFDKNYLYNALAICLILLCYVVLERFLALPFWVYLLVIALLLATAINWIVMVIKNHFDCRYKK